MNRRGFTLVELMLASLFFSVIMILIIVGFVQITRTYTKGNTVKEIQSVSRNIIQDISRQVRVSEQGSVGYTAPSGSTPGLLCAGTTVYMWNHFNGATQTTATASGGEVFKFGKVENAGVDCNNPASFNSSAVSDYEELIPGNVVLQNFEVQRTGSLIKLTIVLSGSALQDLETTGINAKCKASIVDQYCSVARLSSGVTPRNSAY